MPITSSDCCNRLFFLSFTLLICQYQFKFTNYEEEFFHLAHSQLKLGLIFLNVKKFIKKLYIVFF